MRTLIKHGLFFAVLAALCMSGVIYAGNDDFYGCSSNRFAGFQSACQQSPWDFGGHIESGLYVNQYGQTNSYVNRPNQNGGIDPWSGNTALLQNVRQSDFQLNQGAVHLEKKLRNRCGWDIGGRIDYVFGTDAIMMQSRGLENSAGHSYWGSGDYYSALAQAYAEVGYGNLSIKVGKFFTPMGTDHILSPDRFFYSLSKNFGMLPVTHTGALATLDVYGNDSLSVFGGWTQGQDEFFESGENNALIGGFKYKLNPCTTVGYSFLVGQNNYLGNEDYFINTAFLNRKLGHKWEYELEWVHNDSDNTLAYGLNNSLYYTIDCKWSLGFRAEWMHANDYELSDLWLDDSVDIYGLVFGANWKPCNWFTLRPEIRYDSIHGAPGAFDLGNKSGQLAGGFSAIVTY